MEARDTFLRRLQSCSFEISQLAGDKLLQYFPLESLWILPPTHTLTSLSPRSISSNKYLKQINDLENAHETSMITLCTVMAMHFGAQAISIIY